MASEAPPLRCQDAWKWGRQDKKEPPKDSWVQCSKYSASTARTNLKRLRRRWSRDSRKWCLLYPGITSSAFSSPKPVVTNLFGTRVQFLGRPLFHETREQRMVSGQLKLRTFTGHLISIITTLAPSQIIRC